jgi:predicted TPR repeat methyltransferase
MQKRTPIDLIRAADILAALGQARELFGESATVRAKSAGAMSYFYVWHETKTEREKCKLKRQAQTAKTSV